MENGLSPRIRRSFTIIAHSPDVVELRTGVWNQQSFTLRDESCQGKIANLVLGLDGSLTRRELAKREGMSRAEVEAVMDHLYSLGAIEEIPSSALDVYLDKVAPLGRVPDPVQIAERVLLFGDPRLVGCLADLLAEDCPVPVERVFDNEPLWHRLQSIAPNVVHDGLSLTELVEEFAPWRGSLLVTAALVIDPLRFQTLNRLVQHLGTTWVHGALDGPFVFVGPTIVPHRSACWECFEARFTMNLRESASYLAYKNALARGQVMAGDPPLLPALSGLLASHLALEVTNYLHCGSNFSIEKVLGIYLPTMEIAYNEILRMPGCRGCAPVSERDDSSLYFDARSWLND